MAALLLGDRYESLAKYREAIGVYRDIEKTSPYFHAAQVQIAIDQARLNENDKAIANLKAVVAAEAGDAEAWTALGDIYRGVE
jgi:tetratricopeptide (TPR) repeat protein